MGNNHPKPQNYQIVRSFRRGDWQVVSASPQIWRNNRSDELVQIYYLYKIPSIQEINRFEARSQESDIVRVYNIALESNDGMCANGEYVQLLIEYMPMKFHLVINLDLEEALTLLVSVLRGFRFIESNFGAVQPRQELITFNKFGRAKVWLNKFHDINFPDQPCINTQYSNNQLQISSRVRKIFDLVEQKTVNSQLPFQLKEQFRIKNPNFSQAISLIEQFSQKTQLSLTRYLRNGITYRSINNHSRRVSTRIEEQIQIEPVRRQLTKMYSVDSLPKYRDVQGQSAMTLFAKPQYNLPTNFNQRSNIVYQPMNSGRKSTPRIIFNQNMPTNNIQPLVQTRINPPIRYQQTPIVFGSSTNAIFGSQKISANLQTYNNHTQRPQIIFRSNQIPIATYHANSSQTINRIEKNFPSIIPELNSQNQLTEIKQINSPKQFAGRKIEVQIERESQPMIDHSQQSQPNFQIPQAGTQSIIDKISYEIQKQENSRQNELNEQQEILASGTFKPVTQTEIYQTFGGFQPIHRQKQQQQQHQQEQQDYYEQQRQDQIDQQCNKKQLPINFQSFAPPYSNHKEQFASFAPNNNQTQQSIEENNACTSKSVEYNEANHQQPKINAELQHVRSNEADYVNSQQLPHEIVVQLQKQTANHDYCLNQIRRSSIECKEELPQHPFYANYTPVQSKFDVVIKRDSITSRQSQQKSRQQGFNHLEDEEIEKYIRSKFRDYLSNKKDQEEIKVGRVHSQYLKYQVKQPYINQVQKGPQVNKRAREAQQKTNYQSKLQVQNTVNKPFNKISNITEKTEEDFLDVNFLQKSLDKKYHQSSILRKSQKRKEDDDFFNVAKLQEGLIKFSNSKISQQNTEKSQKQNKITPFAQLSKEDFDYKSNKQYSTGFQYQTKRSDQPQLTKKNKKSVRIEFQPTEEYKYQLSDYGKFANFTKPAIESTSNAYSASSTFKINQMPKRSSKLSQNQKSKFQQRYNKYVKTPQESIKPKEPSSKTSYKKQDNTESRFDTKLKPNILSRLLMSPIRLQRQDSQATRLSYDHLKSFLWG